MPRRRIGDPLHHPYITRDYPSAASIASAASPPMPGDMWE
jgi:hypothetical protein